MIHQSSMMPGLKHFSERAGSDREEGFRKEQAMTRRGAASMRDGSRDKVKEEGNAADNDHDLYGQGL